MCLQFPDERADSAIHPVDLCGVCLHPPQLPGLVLRVLPGGLARIALAERRVLLQQARRDHPRQAPFSQLVPAIVVPAVVGGDVLLVRVQRPVRRSERRVQEERPVAVVPDVLADELRALVGDRVGVEERVVLDLILRAFLATHQRLGLVVAAAADQRAEEPVEPAARRPSIVGVDHVVGQMPLSAEVRGKTVGAEHFRRGRAPAAQRARVAGGALVVGENADPGLLRVQPREQ